jgi:septum formation protein
MPGDDQRPILILASGSPRRRELLAQLGVPFAVVIAGVTEYEEADADPRSLVAHNSALKADWVAARNPGAIVLGADTTVFLDDSVLNKPRDRAEARGMLSRLAGRTHTVFTGLSIRGAGAALKFDTQVESRVTFKPLGNADIDAYLARVNTLDKAGGYSIQEHSELIVAGYTGSFTNIMGLPLETTKQILTRCGLLS